MIGGTELVRTLVVHDLVDEFRMMIDPVLLGGGKRAFREDGALKPLRLVDSQATTTGATLATTIRPRADLARHRRGASLSRSRQIATPRAAAV